MATVTASTSIAVTSGGGRNSRSASTTATVTSSARVAGIYVTAKTKVTVSQAVEGDAGYMAGKRYRR